VSNGRKERQRKILRNRKEEENTATAEERQK